MTARELRNKLLNCLTSGEPFIEFFTRAPLIDPDDIEDQPGLIVQVGNEVFSVTINKLSP